MSKEQRLQELLSDLVHKGAISTDDLQFLIQTTGRGLRPSMEVEKIEFGVRFAPDPYVHGRLNNPQGAKKLGEAFNEGTFDVVSRRIEAWKVVDDV